MSKQKKPLYTLVTLEQFKSVLGVDDREDKLAGYCLVTSTYTIKQHCKWWLPRKKYFERITSPCAPKVLPEKSILGAFSVIARYLVEKRWQFWGRVRPPAIKFVAGK